MTTPSILTYKLTKTFPTRREALEAGAAVAAVSPNARVPSPRFTVFPLPGRAYRLSILVEDTFIDAADAILSLRDGTGRRGYGSETFTTARAS